SRTETASFPSAQVKLFEDDSSDDNNVESSFTITCSHEGKKGEKLMKLEARFNSDPRFKLDEKFASSGSDDDNADVCSSRANYDLLFISFIVMELFCLLLNNIFDTRFDPFNEEHISWLKKNQVRPLSIVLPEDAFCFKLKSRSSGQGNGVDGGDGFSFLEMIGRRPTGTDNDYGCNGITLGKFGQPVEQAVSIGAKFFVSGDEPHLQSLINNFKRTQSLEKIVSRWANHRDIFSKVSLFYCSERKPLKKEQDISVVSEC
uniref:RNase NYN domain-containing protein n=1 Tax=Angiostrongylus cantonensis TaxID=6313 RepID=A0A0K0DAA6_ANGCA